MCVYTGSAKIHDDGQVEVTKRSRAARDEVSMLCIEHRPSVLLEREESVTVRRSSPV